jgi:hypothetical protein
VLKFNFSLVDSALDKVESSFLTHIQGTVLSFIRKYSSYLVTDRDYYREKIEKSRSASDILFLLKQLCMESHQNSYAIIDEYDNFANTIISTVGEDAYHNLTHGPGSFKSFFNVLKGGTDGMGAPFTRLFLTGISPITLDDVTSGFNIAENISLNPSYNQMLGFTETDVRKMLNYYQSFGSIKHDCDELMEIINEWYGNYLFSEEDDTRLFNPYMVLYFVNHYLKRKKPPKNLIDRNVRIDYGKLRHLILVDLGKKKTTNGNFDRLKEIIEKGETSSEIEEAFPLEELTDRENFISLLFYFGLLTRRLYYNYIKNAYEEIDIFALDVYTYNNLMKAMAVKGEWKPLFDYITNRMQESMSLRDLITGEKSIQAFLNVYLGLSHLYIIHPEKELNKGYADLVMEPFLARYEEIKYAYLVEIKYIKAEEKPKLSKAKIQKLKANAAEQLKNYSMDKKFNKNIEKTTLVKLVLIFCGHELMDIDQVK